MQVQSADRAGRLRSRGPRWAAGVGATVLAAGWLAPAALATATDPAEVYLIHAVAGATGDFSVDGDVVQSDAAAGAIVGPLELDAGTHEVIFAADGTDPIATSVELAMGQSVDVVAHQAADPAAPSVLTTFPNDMSAVAPGKARLVVAHTATVPPADVRVNGDVLFSNVANGEALTLVVPADTYTVDIVPAATSGPVVLGPVPLTVTAEHLNRVYAYGNPDAETMDAIVRTAPLPVEGANAPGDVDTGSGGQVAALAGRAATVGTLSTLGLVAVLAVAAGWVRRRRPA